MSEEMLDKMDGNVFGNISFRKFEDDLVLM